MPRPPVRRHLCRQHRRTRLHRRLRLIPILGALITWSLYAYAVAHRRNGDWFPGLGEFIIGTAVCAVSAFACGLTALLRRERHGWLAVLPFLAGLAAILYGCRNLLR